MRRTSEAKLSAAGFLLAVTFQALTMIDLFRLYNSTSGYFTSSLIFLLLFSTNQLPSLLVHHTSVRKILRVVPHLPGFDLPFDDLLLSSNSRLADIMRHG